MKISNVFWMSANLVWKVTKFILILQKFGQNLPKIWNFSSLNQKMGFLKSSLNQTFYVLKFWEQWNSSLNRKTSYVLKSKIHFNNMIIQYRNWPAFGIIKAFFWALSDRSNIFDGITNNIMVNLRFHPLNQLWFVIIQTFSLNYDSF